jgi:hypothetical protein
MKQHALLLSTEMVRAYLAGLNKVTRHLPGPTNSLVDGRRVSGKRWKELELDFTKYNVCEANGDTWFEIWSKELGRYVDVSPFYQPGDELYFRETWKMVGWNYEEGRLLVEFAAGVKQWFDFPEDKIDETVEWLLKQIDSLVEKGYLAPDTKDNEDDQRLVPTDKVMPWKPSIHLPKWCTRLFATCGAVSCEPLQAITDAQAIAEGIERATIFDATLYKNYSPGCDTYEYEDPIDSYKSLWGIINGWESWPANPPVYAINFTPVTPEADPDAGKREREESNWE